MAGNTMQGSSVSTQSTASSLPGTSRSNKVNLDKPFYTSTLVDYDSYDQRQLVTLLHLEETLRCSHDYLALADTVGTLADTMGGEGGGGVRPHMREMCAAWLCEVSAVRLADPSVVFHAMSLFDRFLSADLRWRTFPRDKLQLLAGTCYYLASKVRETCPVSATECAEWTNWTFPPSAFIEMEKVVVAAFGWHLDCVSPWNFLALIAARAVASQLRHTVVHQASEMMKDTIHSNALYGVKPSLLAGAAVFLVLTNIIPPSQSSEVHKSALRFIADEVVHADAKLIFSLARALEAVHLERAAEQMAAELHKGSPVTPTGVHDIAITAAHSQEQ